MGHKNILTSDTLFLIAVVLYFFSERQARSKFTVTEFAYL